METTTCVQLLKPEPPRNADSVASMRRSIEQDAAREGSLIGHCLSAARARGLSGEDTYVFLAYHALLQLEDVQQRSVYLSELEPELEAQPAANGDRATGYASGYLRGGFARLVRRLRLQQ